MFTTWLFGNHLLDTTYISCRIISIITLALSFRTCAYQYRVPKMAGVGVQSDLQILSEQRDLTEANFEPTSSTAVANILIVNVRQQLQQDVPHWRGHLDVPYRQWGLRDQRYTSWSHNQISK